MAGPLEGIRAVEWAAYANSPLVGVMLGDFGADVIKIEERGVGEPLRGMSSLHGANQRLVSGMNAAVENTNRNKRSISLDLKKEKGKEIAYKLVEKADVFYTNYGEQRALKVGLDYDSLKRINPQIVYSNNTGYGRRGPDSEKRAFDPGVQARSGLMMSAGERDTPPGMIVSTILDATGATVATLGIITALLARERKGTGQLINSSLLGSALWIQIFNIQTALLRGSGREHLGTQRNSRSKPRNVLSNMYECGDGKWILLGEPQFDRFWGDFCRVTGITDPEFVNVKIAELNKGDGMQRLLGVLDKLFATKPRDEWLKIFKDKNAAFAYDSINDVTDVLNDPQVLANKFFVDFDHPSAGKIKYMLSPIEFSKTPAQIKSAAPEYGQQTEEILLEVGYSWEDIAKLKDEEVI
jgi:CoA:oxalate CoA-transferase